MRIKFYRNDELIANTPSFVIRPVEIPFDVWEAARNWTNDIRVENWKFVGDVCYSWVKE